jgi:3-phosphoshikimate 1-carboxyvinyltransferase
MQPLFQALGILGARIQGTDQGLPATVDGVLMEGGRVSIRPEVSSQFVSSLLLAAPLMRQGLELEVEGELPSRPYVDLTVDMLRTFGVEVQHSEGSTCWRVAAGAARPTTVTIEGDWSAVAFAAGAAAVAGGEVAVGPLRSDSRQGDRAVADILKRAGVEVAFSHETATFRGPGYRSFTADLRDTPDLFPALVVVAAAVPAGSELTGLDHLKHKESDRLSVMIHNLEKLGCRFVVDETSLRVSHGIDRGGETIPEVVAEDDHRVAMAMAVAALAAGPIELDDPDCVAKSFPGFWKTWHQMLSQSEGNMCPT